MDFDLGPILPLAPRDLHVWRADLDRPPAALENLAKCLSAEEQRRASRFVRESDRQRFAVGHAALRTILGKYLGIPPARVETTVRVGGKPELAASPNLPPLRYNLSHSEGLALVALAIDQEVGIDVERVRPMIDLESIVRRYFAPNERATWLALPEHERLAAFFRCWTRKEACLKAQGIGLSAALDQFEVSLAPAEPLGMLHDSSPTHSGTRWRLYDVSPRADYVAACAVEEPVENILVFDWP